MKPITRCFPETSAPTYLILLFFINRYLAFAVLFIFKTSNFCICSRATSHIAHTSSKTHCICNHNTIMLTFVTQHNRSMLCISTFTEIKLSEINPCTPTHLLIYTKSSFACRMTNRIFCIRNRLIISYISNRNPIPTIFRYFCSPNNRRCFFFIGFYYPISTCTKRILMFTINTLNMRKSRFLYLCIVHCALCIIIVNNNLIPLIVTLTRHKNIRPRTFKHRCKIRYYKRKCKFILNSSKYPCTLPLPTISTLFIIPPMTLPKSNISILQTMLYLISTIFIANERNCLSIFRIITRIVNPRFRTIIVRN